MPWLPELFTAPVLQRVLDEQRRDLLVAVPYFDGLLAGDPDPLVESFAGEPEVHDPVRGRVKGAAAFRAFVADTSTWLRERHARVEAVEHVILEGRGFEEVVLHLESDRGPVELPVAVVAERRPDGRIGEVRVYFTGRAPVGRHADRPPLLQPDPGLTLPEPVTAYLRALSTGDVDRVVAALEPQGSVREATAGHLHQGRDALRAFYGRLLSGTGGIPLESCALTDDGRAYAVEYDFVLPGTTEPAPLAGLAVLMAGPSGRLAAIRLYDDLVSPLHHQA